MKTNCLKSILWVVLIVGISVATTLLTQHFVKSTQLDLDASDTAILPAAYAKFASVATAGETDFTVAAELSVNAVVHVKTKYPAQKQIITSDPFFDFFFGRPQYQERTLPQQEASGSGVILSPDGYIVTNNHVVDKASEIEVILNDKRSFKATLVGTDPNTDIALLKIEANDLPVIVMGNSDELKIGEWVLAVGNPFNLTSTVTAGIVSAKARNINILNAAMKIESFIQTDAAVNPGNSGGALVNTRGELVGINTAIASQTGSYAGYSFAVPTSIVQKIVSDIKQYGVVQRAILGVQVSDITDEIMKKEKLNTLAGTYVANVIEMSAAALAGVKNGDVITAVDNVKIKSSSELIEHIGRHRPGDTVRLEIVRNGKTLYLDVKLKNRQGTTEIVARDADMKILGATFENVSDAVKQKLGISYGLQIRTLTKGKLQAAGISNNFIILKINNKPIRTETDLQQVFENAQQSSEQEKVLFIAGVYPNGKVAYYAVNLAE